MNWFKILLHMYCVFLTYSTAEALPLAEPEQRSKQHLQAVCSLSLPHTKMPSDSNRKQLCPQATSVLTAHTLWVEKSRSDSASSKICLRCRFCISVIHQL